MDRLITIMIMTYLDAVFNRQLLKIYLPKVDTRKKRHTQFCQTLSGAGLAAFWWGVKKNYGVRHPCV